MSRQHQNRRRRHLRWAARCCALAVAVVLLLGLLPWKAAPMVVPALSPLVAIATSIATRSIATAALIAVPVLLIALVRRRWFCRWMCPVGLSCEVLTRISPVKASKLRRVPRIGRALVLMSLAAAAFGYPLLLWLDPLAVFSGPFNLGHEAIRASGWVSAAVLGGVILSSLPLPGVWCGKLCMLGATQELVALPRRMLSRWTLRRAMLREQAKSGATAGLPSSVVVGNLPCTAGQASSGTLSRRAPSGLATTRRSLLTMAASAVCVGVGARLGWTGRAKGQQPDAPSLRPPGAVQPWQFAQLCLRCGNCARACPAGIIRPNWSTDRIAAWLTPRLVIEKDYCREDCSACMRVCPSGAIATADWVDGDLQQKASRPIGLAQLAMDRCLLALDRECRTMCREACPYQAISLHEWTWEDDRRYPIIDATKCPGCGACVLACQPMDAIAISPLSC